MNIYTIEGDFHSVNADAMTSKNYAIYNQRKGQLHQCNEPAHNRQSLRKWAHQALFSFFFLFFCLALFPSPVAVIDTAGYANIGLVAYVSIGALCVGSITFLPSVGSTITKGDDLGFFQFGGSTVALVFEKGQVEFEKDIMEHSVNKVETLVQMGSRLGRVKT